MRIDEAAFEALVDTALEELPDSVLEALANIAVIVEDRPTAEQIRSAGLGPGWTLHGLYEGIPLSQRNSTYSMVLPDKITIFRLPIQEDCDTGDEIKDLVKDVVRHEIAHHFGFSDDDLDKL